MLELPVTAPADLRRALENIPAEFDRTVPLISESLRRIFSAELCLVAIDSDSTGQRPRLVWSAAKELFNMGLAEQSSADWIERGIHRAASLELQAKLSPVSFSRFSWPYPRTAADAPLVFPREFSLLIPINSELVVRFSTDAEFRGYAALMFPAFPDFSDDLVQQIITLPALLSELTHSIFRAAAPTAAKDARTDGDS
jgi:hypothetical protein